MFEQLKRSGWIDMRKPYVEIEGKKVTLSNKWCINSSDLRITFGHRYYDEMCECFRTEWIVWFEDIMVSRQCPVSLLSNALI
jgi:hypothetical protein